jgi:tetratricopeptide (TPR) repeat protein
MPSRASVAEQFEALFEDGGAIVLGDGGTHATWEQAVATLPDALFQVSDDTPPLTLLTLARDLWSRQGDLRMATAVTRGLIGVSIARLGREHPDTLTQLGALGALAQRAGRIDEGATLLEEAWDGLRSVVGGRDLRLAVVAGNLGLHYARTGQYAEAEHCLQTALKIRQAVAPHTVAMVAGQLGEVRLLMGHTDEGLDALDIAYLADFDHLGEHHPTTLRRMFQLALALSNAGRYRRAVPLWRTADGIAREAGNAERIAQVGFELGRALLYDHKREEGIRRMREALQWTRRASSPDRPHPELANRLAAWAQHDIDSRRPHEAEELLREAVDVETTLSGVASARTARRQAALGRLLAQMGRLDEALGYLESAASLLLSTEGPESSATVAALEGTLGLIAAKAEQLVTARDREGASAMIVHAIQLGGPVLGFDHKALGTLRQLAEDHRLRLR